MDRSCSSSSSTSSTKYEFSDSDSDHKCGGKRSRPRRLPTSNSKNAVAARINRMKQKQYVKDLEQKMSLLKRKVKGVKRALREREEQWASSRRQVAYLRSMIANSHQIGGLLRNIRWRNIVPQGSNIDKTLNELNSDAIIDHFPITASHSLFDGCFDLLDEKNSDHHPVASSSLAPRDNEGWALLDGINPSTTEVGVCLHVSNRRISVEFCDECSARFYNDPYGSQI